MAVRFRLRAGFLFLLCGLLFAGREAVAVATDTGRPPNIVLILADDLGYGDLGCYGARDIPTPNLDRMAATGLRFTSFCVAQPVCSSSRAAILTGCYPNRIGILGALGPRSVTGLSGAELTIAGLLKARGYATAIFGKWHLGDPPVFSPLRHGFDHWFGLPYSNDMWPRHPQTPKAYPELPLFENERVIELNPDQHLLTRRYTEHAIAFIEAHRQQPFFAYVAHSMPHVPLHVGPGFQGTSRRGAYGDVIHELDDSVGRILKTLKRLDLERNTIVIFLSDNGPWLSYGNHGGSSGGLREGKGTVFEGGVRVPCIIRWPGKVTGGRTTSALATAMDLMPTLAHLAGASLPEGRVIDGVDLGPLLVNPGKHTQVPRETFFYYWLGELHAVRHGRWKLHLPHPYIQPNPAGNDGAPGRMISMNISNALFDLESDPAESRDQASAHPEVVAELTALAQSARADLGDTLTKVPGAGKRPAGRLP